MNFLIEAHLHAQHDLRYQTLRFYQPNFLKVLVPSMS